MTDASAALSAIPKGLRDPLLAEYRSIVQNYAERRWSPSELSGGKFCEIVYSILQGYATNAYPLAPSKPGDFVSACRTLETYGHVPRSFQILIPRALPTLYEVRNNRGVGHVGGEVDPNHMDATLVVSMCNWIIAEIVRVFHNLSVDEAQALVDSLAERRVPIVWQSADMRRVLDPTMGLQDQILVLVGSSASKVSVNALLEWLGYKNRTYFLKLLRMMHGKRLIELAKGEDVVEILPPGSVALSKVVSRQVPA